MRARKRLFHISIYLVLIALGLIMVYPLLWMFFGTFKENRELFGSMRLLPEHFSFRAYVEGWNNAGTVTFGTFFRNSFLLTIPTVLFTVLSSLLVAYGFTRFQFPLKNVLFAMMIGTMMLPSSVVLIPRYILFRDFRWLNTYLPFYVPALFACSAFFVFMMVQFMRGIPRTLDESAFIDGAGTFTTFWHILFPLCKPAIFSVIIIQFIWTWGDFTNSLIFINSVTKYPLSLGLRIAMDGLSKVNWNQILAMSTLSILPPVLLFFSAQEYFVEGIATTGIKG